MLMIIWKSLSLYVYGYAYVSAMGIADPKLIRIRILTIRAVDSHSFFAHPDPAFFLNADQDPALKICTNHLIKSFLELTDKKDCYKVKTFFFAGFLIHFLPSRSLLLSNRLGIGFIVIDWTLTLHWEGIIFLLSKFVFS